MAHFLTPSLNTFQKIIVLMQSVKNKFRRNSIVIKKKVCDITISGRILL